MFQQDRERIIKRDIAWPEFKESLSQKYEKLDIEKILQKQITETNSVVSYGIIEFVLLKDKVAYHMFRRRNTVEYDLVIRGFSHKHQLFELLSLLSQDERDRILNNNFKEIWEDFWVNKHSKGRKTLKSQSQRKFDEIKELLTIINKYAPCTINERPLIFPKGKKSENETELDAAIRETEEEINCTYYRDVAKLYFKSPITQRYKGSDGRKYETSYYVWKRDQKYKCPKKNLNGISKLRNNTISHELESDVWIEIPIFENKKDEWEWQNSINPYKEFGIYHRHFETIMIIHDHIT